jgi:hypothetical protein
MDETRLSPTFKRFLGLLHAERAEYLVVGGYAVRYYGYLRATNDLDVWTATNPDNAAKLVSVCRAFGLTGLTAEPFLHDCRIIAIEFPPVNIEILHPVVGQRPDVVARLSAPRAEKIEILTIQSGVQFEDCYRARVIGLIDGVEVSIIGLPHLKIIKQVGGRPHDLVDLANLP